MTDRSHVVGNNGMICNVRFHAVNVPELPTLGQQAAGHWEGGRMW